MLSLWDYARAVYSHEEIRGTLLSLQDRFRLDVNLILWAVWCGRFGLKLSDRQATSVISSVSDMAEHATRPLRGVRRYLSTDRIGFPPDIQAELREKVLAIEIASEVFVLNRLDAATRELVSAEGVHENDDALAEQLFIFARSSMDMPTVIADEEASFSPIGLFRDILKLAKDHGP